MSANLQNFAFADYIESNATLSSCPKEFLTFLPSTKQLYGELGLGALILLLIAIVIEFLLLIMFIDEICYVFHKYSSRQKSPTVAVLSIYPVIGITCVLSILIPKAQDVCYNCGQVWLSAAFYQFLCLTMEYYGGENKMVQKLQPATLPLKGPPCCCLPCCICPEIILDKKSLKIMKASIMQLPISQAFLFLLVVSLSMGGWYTPGKLFQNLKEYLDKLKVMVADAHMWILAINFISSVLAIWALLVIVRISQGHLDHFHHYHKFMVLEFVLIFAKVQNPLFEFLAKNEILPCAPSLSPLALGNLIFNGLLLTEMIFLSIVARNLYKRICPEMAHRLTSTELVECTAKSKENHVCTQTSESINRFPTMNSLTSVLRGASEITLSDSQTAHACLFGCESASIRVFHNPTFSEHEVIDSGS